MQPGAAGTALCRCQQQQQQQRVFCAEAAASAASAGVLAELAPPAEMSDTEKFLLDLHGFLVVPDFLSAAEVDALNESFDANWDRRIRGADNAKRHAMDQFHGMLGWPQPHSQPFRDLLAHRKLVPYLNTLFGWGWRMDHSPFMLTGVAGFGGDHGGGMAVHGGGQRGDHGGDARGAAFYRYANGVMRSGMIVCSFQLAGIEEGDGGFGCIPGSREHHQQPFLPCFARTCADCVNTDCAVRHRQSQLPAAAGDPNVACA